MGRLKQLPSRLTAAPQRLAPAAPRSEAERSRLRDASQAWRAWYKTSRWQKLRWSILVRDLFTCARCNGIEADTSQLVADHIEPHKGNVEKFWNPANLQCLCKTCHDKVKQAEERASGW